MITMTLEELYECGENFEAFISRGTKSERLRIPKNYSRVVIDKELEEKIKSLKGAKFLCVGEIWCPDCQLNLTALKKMSEINTKLEISIITFGRGRKFLQDILEIEEIKVPTIVALTDDYKILGTFVEAPSTVKVQEESDELELIYMKGRYLRDTVEELCDLLK